MKGGIADGKSPRRAGDVAPLRKRWIHLAAPLVVAALAYLTYANAQPNALVHDDKFFFPHNHTFTWQEVGRFFTEDTWAATGEPSGVYRPLLLTSIAIDQYAHRDQPWAFHRTNVWLHVVATLLVYLFLRALLGARSSEGGSPAAANRAVVCAAVAAVVFAVHPIHTEAVDSIFNRSEMLATMGLALALWVLLRFEGERRVLAWAVASSIYFAALLCRESAATIPFVAALMLLLVRFDGPLAQRVARLAPILLMGVPLAIYLLLRHNALGSFTGAPPAAASLAEAGAGWGSRLATTLAMLRESLRMVVWPHPLRTTYVDFDASGLASAIAVHALLAVAFAVAMWRRVHALAFGIAAFYVTLLPSTRLFTGAETSVVVAERYVYLPSAFLAVPLAVGMMSIAERQRFGLAWAIGIGGALSAVLIPITYRRNAEWHGAERLFEADFQATESGDALRLLTGAYVGAGKYARVAELCDRHLAAHLDNAKLDNNCATAYLQTQRFADAEAAYKHALSSGGIDAVSHANLGRLYSRQGRDPEAEREFSLAVDSEPEPARKHWRRGQAIFFFHSGEPARLAEAETEFEAAARQQPSSQQYAEWLRKVKDARRRLGGSPAAQAPPPAPAAAASATLSVLAPASRAQLVARLSGAAPGSAAWIVYDARDASAEALARQLGAAFEEARWTVRRLSAASISLRPGLFLLAADDPPSDSAAQASSALEAAQLKPTVGTGYRAFAAERRRTQPNWRGVDFEPEQSFVIAVGRSDSPRAAEAPRSGPQ